MTEKAFMFLFKKISSGVLPPLNACLNALATILLVAGFLFIKSGRRRAHRNCMILALLTSALFLTSYLINHHINGYSRFGHEGLARVVYFTILISHTILAMVNLPMVIATVMLAAFKNDRLHRSIARWTLPIWLYVSVTGVVIYFYLYHWFA